MKPVSPFIKVFPKPRAKFTLVFSSNETATAQQKRTVDRQFFRFTVLLITSISRTFLSRIQTMEGLSALNNHLFNQN